MDNQSSESQSAINSCWNFLNCGKFKKKIFSSSCGAKCNFVYNIFYFRVPFLNYSRLVLCWELYTHTHICTCAVCVCRSVRENYKLVPLDSDREKMFLFVCVCVMYRENLFYSELGSCINIFIPTIIPVVTFGLDHFGGRGRAKKNMKVCVLDSRILRSAS